MLATLLARRDAFGCFNVVNTRFRRGTPPRRHPLHDDFESLLFAGDLQSIIHLHQPRWLHALAIDVHQATRHCIGGLRATLEETGKPQPFIDTQASVGRGNL